MAGSTYPGSGAVGVGAPEATGAGTDEGAGVGSNLLEHAYAGPDALRNANPTAITLAITAPAMRIRVPYRSRKLAWRTGRRERRDPRLGGLCRLAGPGRRDDVVK